MWTIVFLAMGGIALGKGVISSGLLDVMDAVIRDLVNNFSLYSVVLILAPVVLVSIYISKLLYVHVHSPSLGDFHLHQSHDSERAARTHSKRSRRKPRASRECPYLYHRTHLFRWYGYASVRVPESNCVRVLTITFFRLSLTPSVRRKKGYSRGRIG